MEEKEQVVLIMVQGLDKARAGVVKMAAQWTSCWTSVCPPNSSSAGATWIVKGWEGWSRCARRRVARELV